MAAQPFPASPTMEGRATVHAVTRFRERYNIDLDEALAASLIETINRSRAIMAADPTALRACVDNGAVHTKISTGVAQRWSVRAPDRRWLDLVIHGVYIVTALSRISEKLPRRRHIFRAARNSDFPFPHHD